MKGIEYGHVLWCENPQQQIICVSFYWPILTASVMQHYVECYVGNWALSVILAAVVVCVFEVSSFYLYTIMCGLLISKCFLIVVCFGHMHSRLEYHAPYEICRTMYLIDWNQLFGKCKKFVKFSLLIGKTGNDLIFQLTLLDFLLVRGLFPKGQIHSFHWLLTFIYKHSLKFFNFFGIYDLWMKKSTS